MGWDLSPLEWVAAIDGILKESGREHKADGARRVNVWTVSVDDGRGEAIEVARAPHVTKLRTRARSNASQASWRNMRREAAALIRPARMQLTFIASL